MEIIVEEADEWVDQAGNTGGAEGGIVTGEQRMMMMMMKNNPFQFAQWWNTVLLIQGETQILLLQGKGCLENLGYLGSQPFQSPAEAKHPPGEGIAPQAFAMAHLAAGSTRNSLNKALKAMGQTHVGISLSHIAGVALLSRTHLEAVPSSSIQGYPFRSSSASEIPNSASSGTNLLPWSSDPTLCGHARWGFWTLTQGDGNTNRN